MPTQAPPEVQRMFADLWAGLQRDNLKREQRAAEADPRAHRLSRTFNGPGGTNYHYVWGGLNGKGQSVYYCWSIHRNVAGYFLSWRQTRQKSGVTKRDQWAARRARKAAQALAKRRAAAFARQRPVKAAVQGIASRA
jgi:hypothetical protein